MAGIYDNPMRGGGQADYAAGQADFDPIYDRGGAEAKYMSVSPDAIVTAMENPMYFSSAPDKDGYKAISPDWLTEQWNMMQAQSWFKGFLSREEACTLLDGQRPGTFVVRVSVSQPGHYAISVVQPKNHFEHMLILPSFAGKDSSAPGNTRYRLGTYSKMLFNTVPKLVAYYNAHPYIDKHVLVGDVVPEEQAGGYLEVTPDGYPAVAGGAAAAAAAKAPKARPAEESYLLVGDAGRPKAAPAGDSYLEVRGGAAGGGFAVEPRGGGHDSYFEVRRPDLAPQEEGASYLQVGGHGRQ